MDEGHPDEAVELIEPPRRRRRTHCGHGHELSGANVYRPPSRPNEIECRICRRERRPPHKPSPNPNGRPPHRPTPELRKVVRNLASMALTHEQIAKALGVGVTSLEKHYADDLAVGQITIHAAIGSVFVKKCLGGDPNANDPNDLPNWRRADVPSLLHFVRTRLGWTEQEKVAFKFGTGHDFETI
jgi:hypothetical protein